MNSLLCGNDGRGTGGFPSFLLYKAASRTTKLGDRRPRWDLRRLLPERACVPGLLCCSAARVRLRVRGGQAPTSALHRGRRLGASRSRAAAAAAAGAAVATVSAEFRGPGGGRLPHTGAEMSSTAAFYLLSTLGGYLVTSFLLLKYPTLLHQRKKQRFLSKHISHRGGERGPQNQMAEVGEAPPTLPPGPATGAEAPRHKAGGWKYV